MLRQVGAREPDQSIVERLQGLLDMAKAGEVTSIAIAAVLTERRIHLSHRVGETGLECFALIGAVADLQRGIGQAAAEVAR